MAPATVAALLFVAASVVGGHVGFLLTARTRATVAAAEAFRGNPAGNDGNIAATLSTLPTVAESDPNVATDEKAADYDLFIRKLSTVVPATPVRRPFSAAADLLDGISNPDVFEFLGRTLTGNTQAVWEVGPFLCVVVANPAELRFDMVSCGIPNASANAGACAVRVVDSHLLAWRLKPGLVTAVPSPGISHALEAVGANSY